MHFNIFAMAQGKKQYSQVRFITDNCLFLGIEFAKIHILIVHRFYKMGQSFTFRVNLTPFYGIHTKDLK